MIKPMDSMYQCLNVPIVVFQRNIRNLVFLLSSFYTILETVKMVLFFLYLQNHDGRMSPNEGSNSGTYDLWSPEHEHSF